MTIRPSNLNQFSESAQHMILTLKLHSHEVCLAKPRKTINLLTIDGNLFRYRTDVCPVEVRFAEKILNYSKSDLVVELLNNNPLRRKIAQYRLEELENEK